MKTSKERIGRIISVTTLAAIGMLGLASCAESSAPTPTSGISTETIKNLHATTIEPGQTEYIEIIDPKSTTGAALISESPALVDHIYPQGPTDPKAPQLGTTPARFRSEVVLSGSKSNYLDNDAACDTINLEPGFKSITAVALGGTENGSYIVWPTKRGEPSNQIELCYFQNSEPTDGIVLVGNK